MCIRDRLVFDGVFDGDDAAVDAVELGEEGVEGGGFAGAGGAGDEDDAVGFGEEEFDLGAVLFAEAEAVEGEACLAGEAEADGLAFDAGDAGDADVDGLAVGFEMDAAVLGEALLGDVEFAHHPVSYTHLDVYKRQVQPSAMPSAHQ